MKKSILLLAATAAMSACSTSTEIQEPQLDVEFSELASFNPVKDMLYRAPGKITIDGIASKGEWDAVPYLSDYVDIEGKEEFKPHLSTKTKIAYDDRYFYVITEMETPDLWGEYMERDDVICLENDFEIFADFSGDTHNYVEFEINAQNTVWDLLMTKPYRDGGKCYNGFNFLDFETAVKRYGTINNPKDKDLGCTVEIALPWEQLLQAHSGRTPKVGDQYRINFLRIEHPLKVEDGKYVKAENPKYGKVIGDHWTWSPVGRIDLHSPDLYGYIQVSDKVAGEAVDAFVEKPEEDIKWKLRRLYYRQKQYSGEKKQFAQQLSTLKVDEVFAADEIANLKLETTTSTYEITYSTPEGMWHIINDGRIWFTKN